MIDTLLTNGFLLLAAAATAFVVPKLMALLQNVAAKYHLQTSIISQQQVEAFTMQQILRVKEEAAAAIKAKVPALSSEEKLEAVVSAVLDKFPGITPEEADHLTHALLASVGEGATVLTQAALQDLFAQQLNGAGLPFGKVQ